MSSPSSYLIVGAGAFGASAALHLIRTYPTASVVLFDQCPFPSPYAAAHDLNKIIRADYADIFYLKLALEAQRYWREDPVYKPYYHQTGMLLCENQGICRQIESHYRTLGMDAPLEWITPKEIRSRFGGVLKGMDLTDVQRACLSPSSGWGEAESAVTSVVRTAIGLGVTYVTAKVSKLIIDGDGTCMGIQTEGGRQYYADRVIACAGARTAKLFADTAPDNKRLQVDGRLVAAGAVMASVRVPSERRTKFKDAPVLFNDIIHGESIPPNSEGLLKFTYETSFTNMIHHEASNQMISVPPEQLNRNTWHDSVPKGLMDEVLGVKSRMYGEAVKDLDFQSYRMAWDAVTPNQDWIISAHPHCKGLYVAGGGSFHSWKFLPILGSFIVQALQGTLDAEKARKWAWDREDEGAVCAMYIPKRDLKDITGYAEFEAKQKS